MNSLIRTPAALSMVTCATLVALPMFVVMMSIPNTVQYVLHTAGIWPLFIYLALVLPAFALGVGALCFAPALRVHTSAKQYRLSRLCTRWGAAYTACAIGLSALLINIGGQVGLYVGVMLWFSCSVNAGFTLVPWSRNPLIIALLLTLVLIPVIEYLGWPIMIWPLIGGVSTWCSRWTFDVFKNQRRIHDVEAALQLSQERLRIAQELHDSLGHQLAAMSMKTQLATAFAEKNDPRLGAELRQLHTLIHDSSEQMREVVRGYRTVDPANELDSARSLLVTAGIAVSVYGDFEDLTEHTIDHSMLAWFIREATTNVLRHSNAQHVAVEISPQSLSITNDGAANPVGPLSGLATIRQRCVPLGGSLSLTQHSNDRVSAVLHWGATEENNTP
ncbi:MULTISPECIES: sensor histidine kinase [unclassified Corynebacterium]|uniref:sensor histidine kinase n=1 Tax=unclassified Corynebacterium TaxID=2624378 RepID=UPI00124DBE08|nr:MULTISPECIES: histidine kinase [unclassified Corynebacterium]